MEEGRQDYNEKLEFLVLTGTMEKCNIVSKRAKQSNIGE